MCLQYTSVYLFMYRETWFYIQITETRKRKQDCKRHHDINSCEAHFVLLHKKCKLGLKARCKAHQIIEMNRECPLLVKQCNCFALLTDLPCVYYVGVKGLICGTKNSTSRASFLIHGWYTFSIHGNTVCIFIL